jgi:hypothetical protein
MIQNAAKLRSHSFTSIFNTLSEPRSVLEAFIINILKNLDGDVSSPGGQYVEYWYRYANHKNIRMLEAHRDIDEVYATKNQIPATLGSDIKFGCQKCPTYGHVVYLSVRGNVLAPTLVYEEEKMSTSDIDMGTNCNVGAPGNMTALWSVPAVSNRFLRFRGDAMHAVNYPPFGFLNSKELDGIKDYQLDLEAERSVLLFNVWKDPPLYPPVEEPLSNQECQYWSDLCVQPHGKLETPTLCKGFQDWNHISNGVVANCKPSDHQRDKDSLSDLKVPLLGNISRRACLDDTLHHKVILEDVIQAFGSKDSLHRIPLF